MTTAIPHVRNRDMLESWLVAEIAGRIPPGTFRGLATSRRVIARDDHAEDAR